jgi:glycosyltransferase involved in cell wall biosynthesis
MEHVDLVADQFVIGWYAMFAIEAMAMGKPVLCYLREDFIDLYVKAGLVTCNEIPLINTGLLEILEKIRWAYNNRGELSVIGKKGREFVQKHHSTEHVGRVFAEILKELGVKGK